ncbi:sigma-70 family RNA polymerase sigma factor [Humisphaera borealis]|uniref:Sigma-70 family RNA polymerase sigma factor n=1 Tax=Humisphaera borealis TaxID=2807512 RepID=A0A7M2WZS7_9BACT|nr:sigma-70 family RNA polymerase sigma factor [Humisphaera borealis]QOV90939.1 sigma-70 family RNA polymerase sigma factor [Humisphaera borealis]
MASPDRPLTDEAFLQAFLSHQRALYAYTLTLLRAHADADDVFQEMGMALWRKRQEFRAGSNFYAWASRVAYLEVCNFRAKLARQRKKIAFDDTLLERVSSKAVQLAPELEERRLALDECLKKLPPRDRVLLEKRFAPGVTIRTLAEQIGRPLEGLYKAVRRIQDALQDCVHRTVRSQREPT